RYFKLPVKERIRFAGLLAENLEFLFALFKTIVDFDLVSEVESNRPIYLFQCEDWKRLSDALGWRTAQEGVNDGIERDTRSGNPITTIPLLDVLFSHEGLQLIPILSRGAS